MLERTHGVFVQDSGSFLGAADARAVAPGAGERVHRGQGAKRDVGVHLPVRQKGAVHLRRRRRKDADPQLRLLPPVRGHGGGRMRSAAKSRRRAPPRRRPPQPQRRQEAPRGHRPPTPEPYRRLPRPVRRLARVAPGLQIPRAQPGGAERSILRRCPVFFTRHAVRQAGARGRRGGLRGDRRERHGRAAGPGRHHGGGRVRRGVGSVPTHMRRVAGGGQDARRRQGVRGGLARVDGRG